MVKFSVQVQVRSIIDADIGQFYNIQIGGPPKKRIIDMVYWILESKLYFF